MIVVFSVSVVVSTLVLPMFCAYMVFCVFIVFLVFLVLKCSRVFRV